MSPVGFILILWLGILFFKKIPLVNKIQRLLVATIFFELFANSGTLCVGVKYADLLWILLFFEVSRFLSLRKITPQGTRKLFIFASILFLSLFIECICPFAPDGFNFRSILVCMKYIFMIYVLNATICFFNESDIRWIVNIIFKFQILIYCIASLEFISENLFGFTGYGNLIESVFGAGDNQVVWNDMRVGFSSIQCLCKEPSHLAICLFFSNIFNTLSQKLYGRGARFFLVNCFLLLVSGSLSSILYILGSIVVWMSFSTKRKILSYIIGLSLIFICFAIYYYDIIQYYISRLTNIIEFSTYGIEETTSEGHRLGDVLWSYKTFCNHPVFGIGLGNNVNTGAFFSLLSTMGLLGFFVYYSNIVKTKKIVFPLLVILVVSIFAMDGGLFYSSYFLFFLLYYCMYFKIYNSNESITR